MSVSNDVEMAAAVAIERYNETVLNGAVLKGNPSKRRWTYASPDGQFTHELDHFLSNRSAVSDVAVVQSFYCGSDHRLLRAKINLNPLKERLNQLRSRRPPPRLLATVMAELEAFDVIEVINADYASLVERLQMVSKQATSPAPNYVNQRITERTRKLLERRR
ncbi:uncharacterized protein LOC110828474 [Zootermopsis nevadensis]|uniref:uncharacterized protein LOC110828474 n=1 Tax=Zootermopsis nevadensis TaxID=136037 RepID=UPI000B8EBC1E|nr:uncharacterized protein LOC110828474 [Zootermopsis nevadensis]